MNIDFMRKTDYFVGIPIMFLLTLCYKAGKLFGFFNKKNVDVKRVLFIELSEMGSVILADPAIQKVKRQLNSEVFFLIFHKNKSSLDILNSIERDNIFTIRDDNLLLFAYDTLRFFVRARKCKIDAVIDLELFSRATAILSALCGAKYRVGFYGCHNEGLYRGDILTHKVSYNPHIHIAKNFIALVNALSSDAWEEPYPKSEIGDEEIKINNKPLVTARQKQNMADKIKALYPQFDLSSYDIVLVNANSSDLLPQRCWPVAHFVALTQKILNHGKQAIVLLTGSESEKDYVEKLCRQVAHERCLNFAGHIKLSEFATLCSVATLLVGNDSGPGHFAAATDLPTYVIFGPETPALYRPLGNCTPIYAGLACSPCVSAANHRKTACHNNRCVQVIRPEFVFEMIRQKLE